VHSTPFIGSERIYSLTCTYNLFFCKNRVVRRGSSVSMDLGFGVLRAPRSPAFSTYALKVGILRWDALHFPLSVTRLPLTKRPVALRPRLAASLPLSQRRSASACGESYTCERGGVNAPCHKTRQSTKKSAELRRILILRTRVNRRREGPRSIRPGPSLCC
jgi:hypothetical protein